MSFVELFFQNLANITNTNLVYDLILSNNQIVSVSNCGPFDNEDLQKEFVPCYCDSGHPILTALRNFDKPCICKNQTYIKVLQRSGFPKTVLTRVIGHSLTLQNARSTN